MTRAQQLIDGEWDTCGQTFTHICCGCGLAHVVNLRKVSGHYQIRLALCPRVTSAVRRETRKAKARKRRSREQACI
jgi:hypothetical protein